MESKAHLFGSTFEFKGLEPGDYRATLDVEGDVIAAKWSLGATDLVDHIVVVSDD